MLVILGCPIEIIKLFGIEVNNTSCFNIIFCWHVLSQVVRHYLPLEDFWGLLQKPELTFYCLGRIVGIIIPLNLIPLLADDFYDGARAVGKITSKPVDFSDFPLIFYL